MIVLAAVVVAIFTSAGEIDVDVDRRHAPLTAANFLSYVKRHAYDGGSFFRTVTTHPDNQPGKSALVKIDVVQATVGFAAFGHVISGMDVVRAIQNAPHHAQQLDPLIRIRTIVVRS